MSIPSDCKYIREGHSDSVTSVASHPKASKLPLAPNYVKVIQMLE